jgi:hypothetical protein
LNNDGYAAYQTDNSDQPESLDPGEQNLTDDLFERRCGASFACPEKFRDSIVKQAHHIEDGFKKRR